MRLTQALRHLEFGKLGNKRGVVEYSMSPYEQKAFKGFFTKGGPNLFRRFFEEVGYIVPWFGIAWLAYDWGVKNNAYRKTKAGMIEYGEVELIKKTVDADDDE